jgi:hypothetical protein
MKLKVPLLVVACVATMAPSALAQTAVIWQSPLNVTTAAGTLTKSGGCDGCPDSGARSTQQLTGDGYADFVPGDGRFFGGLGADLSASTSSATINYAFSFWPGGAWEIRELGVYKKDGTFTAGDHFTVSIESGAVVYRRNGSAIYRSAVTPAFPLVLDTTFYSTGSALTGATIGTGLSPNATNAPPPPPPSSETTPAAANPSGAAIRTGVGPYLAVIDRYSYMKPALPAMGPAGTTITDPTFFSSITRLTDGNTRPGYLNRSYRTPSGTHSLAWSAAGTKFYVVSTDGSIIPFLFDASTKTAKRIQPTTTDDGGFVLRFYLEPQFSFVNDSLIYGSFTGPGATLRTIDQYDFSTGLYTTLLNLDTIQTGLTGTFVGGISSSAGPNERILAFFGGTAQDKHHFVTVFDVANPSSYQVLDTLTSTLNGQPAPITLNFSLHHATIDRSGRYVILYPTAADMAGARQASQMYVWDTATNVMTPLTGSAHPYGHDALGYGVSINQDCCTSTTWDAAQWQFRNLAMPTTSRDLIATILSPKETSLADHPSWNNARSDAQVPYVSGLYRYGTNTAPWRAWDDELIAIQTDAPAGTDPTIWRFAHHRSDVRSDTDPTTTYFWYEPRPNISPDGRWVLFTSNWEKSLGTDPKGDASGSFRQDVFLLELESPSSTPPASQQPPPPPPPPPVVVAVAIASTVVPNGQVGVPYAAALGATGGSGSYAWSLASGALPPGLSIDRTLGVISGNPTTAGTFTFQVVVSDTTNVSNSTARSFTTVVSGPPLKITTASALPARQSLPYSMTFAASGGSGSYAWLVTSGTLPPGLSLSSAGTLSGVPTTTGTYNFGVTAADAGNTSIKQSMNYFIVVSAAVKIVAPPPTLSPVRDKLFAYAFTAVNVVGMAKWSIVGTLPQGLTFNTTNGILSGTCKTGGTATVQITVADASTSNTITVILKIIQK